MWKTILGHGIRSKKRPTSRHVITRFYKSGIKSHRGPPCQQYLPLWKSGFEVKTVSALNLPILRPLDSLPHLFCQFLALNNANYFSFFFFSMPVPRLPNTAGGNSKTTPISSATNPRFAASAEHPLWLLSSEQPCLSPTAVRKQLDMSIYLYVYCIYICVSIYYTTYIT